ncbi:hypothetical protein JW868_02830 [Candidatus Woesearchaeota archaeon]|nr:hypothetical protein [Candidatus Woesearchaeota archaeon]
MKRGAISLGFNWIFVIIAGVLVLTTVINIVMKQKDVNDVQNAYKIKTAIGNQVREGLSPTESFKEIHIPESTFSFVCSNSGVSQFRVGDDQQGIQDIPFAPVFAPRSLKTDELLMWSKPFATPFPMGSVLYITSPDVRYVFFENYDNTDEWKLKGNQVLYQIMNRFPETAKTSLTPFTPEILSIKPQGYDRNVFIFISFNYNGEPIDSYMTNMEAVLPNVGSSWNNRDKRTYVLVLIDRDYNPSSRLEGYVIFTHFLSDRSYVKFRGENELIGAIVSEDAEIFDCTVKKTRRRLNTFARIMKIRSENLKSEGPCSYDYLYTVPIASFGNIADATADPPTYNPNNPIDIFQEYRRLDIANQDLFRTSCPQLY